MTTLGKVIAVGNQKGGTGKSTLAINLACAMAVQGKRSLVLDTDPLRTATSWTRQRRLPCFVEPRPIAELADVTDWVKALARARELYDRVIIDLPAGLTPAMATAFLVADAVLIPTTPSPVDVEATRSTIRYARAAMAERPQQPPHLLVVPNLVRPVWLRRPEKRQALTLLDAPVGPTVHHDHAFVQAYARSLWIEEQASRSRGARDIRALQAAVEALSGKKSEELPARAPELLPSRAPELLPSRAPELLPARAPELLPSRAPHAALIQPPAATPAEASTTMPAGTPSTMPPRSLGAYVPASAPERFQLTRRAQLRQVCRT